jgi:hypothetical protein
MPFRDEQTGQDLYKEYKVLVDPKDRKPDESSEPFDNARHSVLKLSPLQPLDMTDNQKELNGIPLNAKFYAWSYPNKYGENQEYKRDVSVRIADTNKDRAGNVVGYEGWMPTALEKYDIQSMFDLYGDVDHSV